VLREALGWEDTVYQAVKRELVARKIVTRGRGRPASRNGRASAAEGKDKSQESWFWEAACSIRSAKDAPKGKDYILPLIFSKRLCELFDDEVNRIAEQGGFAAEGLPAGGTGSQAGAVLPAADAGGSGAAGVERDSPAGGRIGEGVTSYLQPTARETRLQEIIERVDFDATTHEQRDLDNDRLSNQIETISGKRLGLKDVEADITGKSYEYLIRKFAEGSGQSAGKLYTPPETDEIISKVLQPEPGMEIYDPCCGSGGVLVTCEVAMEERVRSENGTKAAPLKLYGQEYVPESWAMANMIILDLEGEIKIGDTFRNPKFCTGTGQLRTFDRVVANPMWNQDWFSETDNDSDDLCRFPAGTGFLGKSSADWSWIQHIAASLNEQGRGDVVLDTGAASPGSSNAVTNQEKSVRQWFVEQDLIESVLYLPENLFYNTTAPGIVVFLHKAKQEERRGRVFLVKPARCLRRDVPRSLSQRLVSHALRRR
jgi:type I restriction enzyme M protein